MKILPTTTSPDGYIVDEGKEMILCPICKHEFTHFGYNPSVNKAEDYLVGDRGGGITLPMSCERGHYWELIISHHKGNSFITTINFKQDIV
jgi:hypothetical protein